MLILKMVFSIKINFKEKKMLKKLRFISTIILVFALSAGMLIAGGVEEDDRHF